MNTPKMTKYRVVEVVGTQITECGNWYARDEAAALDAMAQSVGYENFEAASSQDWRNAVFRVFVLDQDLPVQL